MVMEGALHGRLSEATRSLAWPLPGVWSAGSCQWPVEALRKCKSRGKHTKYCSHQKTTLA
jgi:hypothetical protein